MIDPEHIIAIDTETCLLKDPVYDSSKRRTRHSPPDTPELILLSFSTSQSAGIQRGDTVPAAIREWHANGRNVFAFHNAAFDIFVLAHAFPTLLPLFQEMAAAGRLYDTLLLEQLLQIARGPRPGESNRILFPTLDSLAFRRCGIKLDKDPSIRLTYAQYKDPTTPLSPKHHKYALEDARATRLVFQSQLAEVVRYTETASNPWGPLSSGIQLRGVLAFRWLESFPVCVDLAHAEVVRDKLQTEMSGIQDQLIAFGWGSRGPKTKKFHFSTKKLRQALAEYAETIGLCCERTDSGLVSTEYDYWAGILPRDIGGDVRSDRLRVWLRYQKLQKLLGTYLGVYTTSQVHYPRYAVLGARTGRTACSKPCIHQIPKHRDSLRSLFVTSRPSRVFIEADYVAAELVALAEIYHSKYGGSALGGALNSGADPHTAVAERLAGQALSTLPPDDRARLRQLGKVGNFGLPGGLGAKRLTEFANRSYGLKLTLEEARAFRKEFLAADPELARWLEDEKDPEVLLKLAAENIGISYEQLCERLKPEKAITTPSNLVYLLRLRSWIRGSRHIDIPLRPGFNPNLDCFKRPATTLTGRTRGKCSYTEAHNTPFQGLVADGIKLALFELWTKWTPEAPWQPVACVHDSILVEVESAACEQVAATLEMAMQSGIRSVCPNIRARVEVKHLGRYWGPRT